MLNEPKNAEKIGRRAVQTPISKSCDYYRRIGYRRLRNAPRVDNLLRDFSLLSDWRKAKRNFNFILRTFNWKKLEGTRPVTVGSRPTKFLFVVLHAELNSRILTLTFPLWPTNPQYSRRIQEFSCVIMFSGKTGGVCWTFPLSLREYPLEIYLEELLDFYAVDWF